MYSTTKPKLLFVLFVIMMSLALVIGCSNNSGSSSESPSASTEESSGNENATESSASEETGAKHEPPIEVTTVKQIYPWLTYPEGDSIDNNVWTRLYEEKLGIKTKYLWTVPEDQYQNKLTASISSGDIPDVMFVDENSFKMMLDSNLLEDLTGVYDKHASELLKTGVYGSELGKANLNYGKVDGKLMGLPAPMIHPVETTNILYIRMDWLKKLGLPEPKTIDDVINISKAFANNDPDGNGKKDTFGFALAKNVAPEFPEGIGDLVGFFNGFHAYPGLWLDDGTGKLINGIIQPEMKPALVKLQEMYKDGLIDKEFAVKDRWKVGEDVSAGKFGVLYGVNWTPINPLANTVEKDPKAEWKAFPLVSIDDKVALPQGKSIVLGFYVVKKGFKNPEAVIQMANLGMEMLFGETAKSDPAIINSYGTSKDAKYQYSQYRVVQMNPGDKNLTGTWALKDALEAKDPSKLMPEQLNQYNQSLEFMNGNITKDTFINYKLYEAGSVFALDYYKSNNYLADKFISMKTPTMLEKGNILNDLAVERITKIIMGASVEDEFNKFVSDWKKLGGDLITEEANTWYETVK